MTGDDAIQKFIEVACDDGWDPTKDGWDLLEFDDQRRCVTARSRANSGASTNVLRCGVLPPTFALRSATFTSVADRARFSKIRDLIFCSTHGR